MTKVNVDKSLLDKLTDEYERSKKTMGKRGPKKGSHHKNTNGMPKVISGEITIHVKARRKKSKKAD